MESLEGRLVPANVTWLGGHSGNVWSDGTNWSTGQIPSLTSDDVTIDGNQNCVFDLALGGGHSLTIAGTYTGTLSMPGLTSLAVQTNFFMIGGTFNANGAILTIRGSLFVDGGTIQNTSGSTEIDGTLDLAGGNFTANGVSVTVGGLTLANSNSTLTLGAPPFNVTGDWQVNAGTFNPGGGTVTFSLATGVQSISSGGTAFNNIDHRGGATLELPTNDLAVNGTLTQDGTGTFDLFNHNLTVGGLTTVSNGTFSASGGTANFNGGLVVTGTGTFGGNSAAVNVGNLTLSGGDFTLSSNATNVTGNWSYGGGNFHANTYAVTFSSSGTQTLNAGGAGEQFYRVTHSGTGTLQLVSSPLNLTNNLTNAAGTFDLNGQTLSVGGATFLTGGTLLTGAGAANFTGDVNLVGGNWAAGAGTVNAVNVTFNSLNSTLTLGAGPFNVAGAWTLTGGTFAANGGTVTFNAASGTQSVNSGGQPFFNVVKAGGGTLTVTTPLTVAAALTVQAGTLDPGGSTVTVGGPAALTGGTALTDGGTVNFNGGLTLNGGNLTADNGTVNVTGVNLVAAGSTLTLGSGPFTVTGSWTYGAGAFAPGTGTVTFLIASGTQTLNAGGGSAAFFNLAKGGVGTLQLTGSRLAVAGSLSVQAGTFDANGQVVTVAGTAVINSVYLGSTGAQIFSGGVSLTGGSLGGSALVLQSDVVAASAGLTPSTISGLLDLGAANRTFNVVNNPDQLTVTAAVTDGGLTKSGTGTLVLAADNTYTGATVILNGTLQIMGNQPTSDVTLTGGYLLGTGTLGSLNAGGGVITPGTSVPGTLTVKNFIVSGPVSFSPILNGSAVGQYSQLVVNGLVNLIDSSLVPTLNYLAAVGTSFVVIKNNGPSPVQGVFNGLAEGSTFQVSGVPYGITYSGGAGNDVVLGYSQAPPSARAFKYYALGGAPGWVQVRRLSDNSVVTQFAPFGIGFNVGINVALGDVNKDGYEDIVVAATAGNPAVKVYSGKALALGTFDPNNPDASLITQFFAYALQFNVGASVAVGDVNGDGYPDVVTSATVGNPHVRVYSGKAIALGTFDPNNQAPSLITQFFAYALQFNVGANVAVGDINKDGYADIVTGATAGNPHVKIYGGKAIALGAFDPTNPDADLMGQLFPFAIQFNVGAYVAVGDVNGDGYPDVIAGSSVGNPEVRVYDGHAIALGLVSPGASPVDDFFAYGLGANQGVTVGAADFEGNGTWDILAGATSGSNVFRVLRANASGVDPAAVYEGTLTGFQGGINVGA